jgi:SAM-dependent methyltransferase
MNSDPESVASAYDRNYRRTNYFGYRRWLYRPYVRALIHRIGLSPGSSILDAGCGQGFFTQLFAEAGLDAVGADISSEGVAAARREFHGVGIDFVVGDVLSLPFEQQFDCVFTRSCSLYNLPDFPVNAGISSSLMKYVKPGGVFVFDYYSRLGGSRQSPDWKYHQLDDVRRHFSNFQSAQCYFSLRAESIFLGRFAFSRPVSVVAEVVSRISGIGGELVAIVRKN